MKILVNGEKISLPEDSNIEDLIDSTYTLGKKNQYSKLTGYTKDDEVEMIKAEHNMYDSIILKRTLYYYLIATLKSVVNTRNQYLPTKSLKLEVNNIFLVRFHCKKKIIYLKK